MNTPNDSANLFEFTPALPASAAQASRCTHPPEAHVVMANLFSGTRDLVCDDCHATLAEGWQQ